MELMFSPGYWETANVYANINPPPVLIPLDKTLNENHNAKFDGRLLQHAYVCPGLSALCNWSNCPASYSRSWKHSSTLTNSRLPRPYLSNQNECVNYIMRRIEIDKHKSSSTNEHILPQTLRCFNDKCLCFLSVQSQPNVNIEPVNCDMPDTNNVNSSIASIRQVGSSRRPLPFVSQNSKTHGNLSSISVVNNPLNNIEKPIEPSVRTPLKKPCIKGGSTRKLINENRTTISEHQRRNMQNYYLDRVNSFPKCQLNLLMTLNKLAKVVMENSHK